MSNFTLGVNVDHIATIRNLRNDSKLPFIDMIDLVLAGGADQITAHLRQDRRHINESDLLLLKRHIDVPLNVEISPSIDMLDMVDLVLPDSICLVPEDVNELTTQSGLDVLDDWDAINDFIAQIKQISPKIKVSLFIDPVYDLVNCALQTQCDAIEINTDEYATSVSSQSLANEKALELESLLINFVSYNKEFHAGHGLDFKNIEPIAKNPLISEFNIGYYLIVTALQLGLKDTIALMKSKIQNAR